MNPREIADHLVMFKKDDWLKIMDSLGEPLTGSVGALLEPTDRGARISMDSTVGRLIRLGEDIRRRMEDADRYRRVPESMRSLFESEGPATLTAALRLLESANARIQVGMIERLLRELGPLPECDSCGLKEAMESIEGVLSRSYLDLAQ